MGILLHFWPWNKAYTYTWKVFKAVSYLPSLFIDLSLILWLFIFILYETHFPIYLLMLNFTLNITYWKFIYNLYHMRALQFAWIPLPSFIQTDAVLYEFHLLTDVEFSFSKHYSLKVYLQRIFILYEHYFTILVSSLYILHTGVEFIHSHYLLNWKLYLKWILF